MNVLQGEAQVALPKTRGSRFVAHCGPIADSAEASAFLDKVRRQFPDATHHCWAWHLDKDRWRYSDDGEPSGTAGRPIHQMILGRDLAGVVVVVVRWYGGTKLGTGGLIKAYGAAAAAALDAGGVIPYVPRTRLRLQFGYGEQGAVDAVLHATPLEERAAEYGAEVAVTVTLRTEHAEALVTMLTERTAGRVRIEELR